MNQLNVHERNNPFECNVCDSKFLRRPNRTYGFSTLRKETFLKNENTETLKASVHEKRKPFQSFICGASFAQNAKLKSAQSFSS